MTDTQKNNRNEIVTICNGLKKRAESPVINSVGHRPTERGTKRPTESNTYISKALKGRNQLCFKSLK